jgi:hypothetical protein
MQSFLKLKRPKIHQEIQTSKKILDTTGMSARKDYLVLFHNKFEECYNEIKSIDERKCYR